MPSFFWFDNEVATAETLKLVIRRKNLVANHLFNTDDEVFDDLGGHITSPVGTDYLISFTQLGGLLARYYVAEIPDTLKDPGDCIFLILEETAGPVHTLKTVVTEVVRRSRIITTWDPFALSPDDFADPADNRTFAAHERAASATVAGKSSLNTSTNVMSFLGTDLTTVVVTDTYGSTEAGVRTDASMVEVPLTNEES